MTVMMLFYCQIAIMPKGFNAKGFNALRLDTNIKH